MFAGNAPEKAKSWADIDDDDDEDIHMPDWLRDSLEAQAAQAQTQNDSSEASRAEIAALEDPASIGVAHVDEPQRRCTVGRLHGSLCWTAISCEKRDSSLHYESISEVDEVDEVQTEDDAWDDDKTMEAIDDETAKLFGLPCYDAQQGVDEDAWQDDGRRPVDAARCSPFTTHGTTASLSYDHTSLFGRSPSGIRARSLERPADCVAGSILPLIDRSIWHSEMYRSVD
ncbi:hypothetical protein BCR37DRAFT_377041 [Protomyces lactucae-debilis]|uniref:Uncharacterized protein n=1 Tax=Protomyces lactucae-debilis TaxID=2754530 RepID=A0A1Y2FQZ2_PROLT|nr:uncharacterized protein BCR37DRAFT_377041 [Protomyces lactucae-debilis]ORY86420.1 hypothetical protein BCR37DRAFT_377041 [Protomyces lactucae-debilis]